MNPPVYQARRATIEDLPDLLQLWTAADLPVADLEKRLGEVQVVLDEAGAVVGTLGLQRSSPHGLIHSEVLIDPLHPDELREQLWARVKIVARNYGLARLWTAEPAPFWAKVGFQPADPEAAAQWPAPFGAAGGNLQTLKLREISAPVLDQEWALFQIAQQEENDRLQRHLRRLRLAARVIGLAVLAVILGLGGYLLWKHLTRRH